MLLYLRAWFAIIAMYLSRRRLGVFQPSQSHFTCLPTDTELGRTMNQARFLSFSELAQYLNNVQTGFMSLALNKGWWVVERAKVIEYYRPIKLWSRFHVTAQVVAWDEKAFYWQSKFFQGDDLRAVTYSRVIIRNRKGVIPHHEVFEGMGIAYYDQPPSADLRNRMTQLSAVPTTTA